MKKILSIIIVLALGLGLWFGYQNFLAPKTEEGSKEITIEIVVANKEINESFKIKTDAAFLSEVLDDNVQKLGYGYEESTYGPFVSKMANYTADSSKNEFFSIIINGEDAMYGIKEIPVNDGTVYRFELKTY